ncbi:(deoxy)nucleoside triphosphate pyrophosphohydrolase [Tumebacillus permanentifrigoris]|uniref:8-oxo-dGTP diphosphatase n=1 Tax=Tumebacillus permanentifrigoris TaxID=378543 RepID=A0A316D3Z6_9BACL|nr:(deoxy)nucleoside triphosphate pyrophosphohydrolase [Tumebacillus permanentifrigoris]PWK06943.1 8-oxo-dGTP diphosphatase [Tumebacillus permanentifrigoris]
MKQLVVTAAVIEREGMILLAQRKPDTHMGLKWEFPGGKLEWGEDPRAGLAREISEELGIGIEVGEVLEVVSHTYEDRHIVLLGYRCRFVSGEIQMLDVQDVRWVRPAELKSYDVAPADWPIVDRLLALNE